MKFKCKVAELLARVMVFILTLYGCSSMVMLVINGFIPWYMGLPVIPAWIWGVWYLRIPYFTLNTEKNDIAKLTDALRTISKECEKHTDCSNCPYCTDDAECLIDGATTK